MRRSTVQSLLPLVVIVLFGTVLCGCSDPEPEDWSTAASSHTISAYEDFLRVHPTGAHATAAKDALKELTDWRDASGTPSVQALTEFLEAHPSSEHASAAGLMLVELQWAATLEADTIESYEAFLTEWPNASNADEAQSRLQAHRDREAWEAAERADTIEAMETYLEAFSEGAQAGAARDRLAELRPIRAWWQACAVHTAEAYAAFATEFPDDARSAEAAFRGQLLAYDEKLIDCRSHPATFTSLDETTLVVEVEGPFEMGDMLLPEGGAMTSEQSVRSEGGIQIALLDGKPEPGAPVARYGGVKATGMGGRLMYMWHTVGLAPPGRIQPSELHVAAEAGDADAVARLLDVGMPPGMRDELGVTPLHLAAGRADGLEIVRLLLSRDAEVNAVEMGGETPLFVAIAAGSMEIATVLLEAGADGNLARSEGTTPLHVAARQDTAGLTNLLLLQDDPAVNAKRADGATPLLMAAAAGNYEIVVALLKAKANPNPAVA